MTNINISVSRHPYTRMDTGLSVPPVGTFVQLKHWGELGRGGNIDEYPEMFTPTMGLDLLDPDGRRYDYVELSDAWMQFQWRFWDWNSQYHLRVDKELIPYQKPGNDRTFYEAVPGSLTSVYVSMGEAHRAFTEAGSREAGARDPVLGLNMSNPRNVEWLCNPTCGALLKVLAVDGIYFEIEALDLLKPPPSLLEVITKPWLYFWCTQWSDVTGSTRFPQIKTANAVHDLPEAGVASLLFSKGGRIRVKRSSCGVPLVNGQRWSPYQPR